MKVKNRFLVATAVALVGLSVVAQRARAEGEQTYKQCATCSIMEQGCVGGYKCADSFWVSWCTDPAQCQN